MAAAIARPQGRLYDAHTFAKCAAPRFRLIEGLQREFGITDDLRFARNSKIKSKLYDSRTAKFPKIFNPYNQINEDLAERMRKVEEAIPDFDYIAWSKGRRRFEISDPNLVEEIRRIAETDHEQANIDKKLNALDESTELGRFNIRIKQYEDQLAALDLKIDFKNLLAVRRIALYGNNNQREANSPIASQLQVTDLEANQDDCHNDEYTVAHRARNQLEEDLNAKKLELLSQSLEILYEIKPHEEILNQLPSLSQLTTHLEELQEQLDSQSYRQLLNRPLHQIEREIKITKRNIASVREHLKIVTGLKQQHQSILSEIKTINAKLTLIVQR